MSGTGLSGSQQDSFSRSPDWTHLEKELNQIKQEDLPQQRQQTQRMTQQESPMPMEHRSNTAPPQSLMRLLNSSPAIREDIRYDEQYQQFYSEYKGTHHLPPPIEENSVLQELGRAHFGNSQMRSMEEEDPIKQLERITIGGGAGSNSSQHFQQSMSPMGSNPGTPAPDMNAVLQLTAQGRMLNSISPPIQPGTPTPLNDQVINGLGAMAQLQQQQQQQQIASVFAQANAAAQLGAQAQSSFGQMPFGIDQASALLAAIGGGGNSGGEANSSTPSPQVVPIPTVGSPAPQTGQGSQNKSSGRRHRGRGHKQHAQDAHEESVIHYNEKFKSSDEVIGHVMEVAHDQYGCRFLQKMMDQEGKPALDKFFPEIVEHTVDLMKDPFGNYLIQKVLELCSEEQCTEILRMATKSGDLVEAALNTHGTRAVQKLLETVKTQEQIDMVVSTFEPGVIDLIMDLNGNHVIQKCLQKLGSTTSKFVYEACYAQIKETAKHRHGCCVLQRCLDFATAEQKRDMVERISEHTYELAQDQFGNYVIQYVLDIGDPEATDKVMSQLQGDYVNLSKQKFSSNVVEKCLKMHQVGAETQRERIIKEISESEILIELLQDSYGNYVVQSALAVSTGDLHNQLVEAIKPHIPAIKNTPQGKRLMQKITTT
eukprot:TRINITY_DN1953_c1_g1_i2.p1 TRINITY_DN1953_c1_g1~~TRINITY_DN1953_c1_g1_i2.p1  ORF type:complete len:653 (+),score=90.45 TRINITY_DN1953_c1_g1_i2:241-2199(+)